MSAFCNVSDEKIKYFLTSLLAMKNDIDLNAITFVQENLVYGRVNGGKLNHITDKLDPYSKTIELKQQNVSVNEIVMLLENKKCIVVNLSNGVKWNSDFSEFIDLQYSVI